MSQNDYTIANQTTPLFRADLNNALQALASNSSGPTAPATTYANMTWYDTGTNTLYMRSEADDAWIALGTLNQSTNTFTPVGSLTLASQAEAEAGTDNAKVVTPLRVKQSVDANTLAATAGAAAGAIGTYVFASGLTGQNAFGSIVAGSILRPVALRTTGGTGNFEFANYSGGSNSGTLSGTFRQMGGFHTISTAQITLFLRVS